jgi:hypothetical protein
MPGKPFLPPGRPEKLSPRGSILHQRSIFHNSYYANIMQKIILFFKPARPSASYKIGAAFFIFTCLDCSGQSVNFVP